MEVEVKLVIPADNETWLALRVDDAPGAESTFQDGYITYSIYGVGPGEAKSIINDILRCYAAITHVLDSERE